MSLKPVLSPSVKSPGGASTVILTSTGSHDSTDPNGAANTNNYFLGIYADSDSALYDANFVSGAVDQVAYTFKKLGGDILDIELKPANVYSAYEEAVLEYSYQVNIHQAKNVLSDLLGFATGTFDHTGQMTGGDASGSAVNLSFPRYEFRYARRVGDGFAEDAGFGGTRTMYSASFAVTASVMDYDLQAIISHAASANKDQGIGGTVDYSGLIGNRRIRIDKVYYKTPQAMWRFYGYYGGLNVVGNLNYYGQYSDDTTFELIPAWHNKAQAQAYEDHIWTRLSHYSYEIKNNKLRIYPQPDGFNPYMWVNFTIEDDPWNEEAGNEYGVTGINNMSTLPFENIPYENINAIGKHWIRRYALAIATGMLAQVRGKFGAIPIPGDSVTLNSSDLATISANEITALKEELKGILDEMTYRALAEKDAEMITAVDKVQSEIPLLIYQG